MSKNERDPFYQACIDACEKLNKKRQFGVYAYNILNENGLIDHILNGNINLNDYTDKELKAFRGMGYSTIETIRVAWSLYTNNPAQGTLDIDPAELRGYSTGKDLIRWIKDHRLENKQIYYAGHNCIGFIIDTREFDGMEYHTTCDLDVNTGHYVEIQDHIS